MKEKKKFGYVEVNDNSILIKLEKPLGENQKSEIIGETNDYIISLITNTDIEGKLMWFEIIFTKKCRLI